MSALAAMMAAALACSGTGSVQREPVGELKTMAERVKAVNAGTEGFKGDAALDDGPAPRLTGPTRLLGRTAIRLKTTKSDRDGFAATAKVRTGTLKVEYNRLSRLLVVSTRDGRWIGNCR